PRRIGPGQELTLDAEWLRAIRLQVSGSGIGSVTPEEYLAELPGIAAAVHDGAIDVRARAGPLADVTERWYAAFAERLVCGPWPLVEPRPRPAAGAARQPVEGPRRVGHPDPVGDQRIEVERAVEHGLRQHRDVLVGVGGAVDGA